MFFSVKVLSALIHDDSGHFNNVSKGNKSQTRPFTNVFSLLQDDGVVQKKLPLQLVVIFFYAMF